MSRGRDRARGALAALLVLGRVGALAAAEVAVTTRPAVEARPHNGDSPLDAASELLGTGRSLVRTEVLVRARYEGFTATSSLRLESDDGRDVDGGLEVNELFYDFAILGEHFTLGKKVTSWDVGYAFRPLDVVQREDRRAVDAVWLDGIPQVAWEHFGELASLSVVWANPLAGTGAHLRDDEAVAAKLYVRLPVVDVHVVARYSARDRVGAGLGLALVLGDGLELHASGLWQQRLGRVTDPLAAQPDTTLAATNPVSLTTRRDALSALVGGTYTFDVGISVLAEAYHDPGGATAAEWRAVRDLARRQRALLGGPAPDAAVRGNLAWTAGFLDRSSLLQDQLVVRVSYRDAELEPAVDVLVAADDPGFVASASFAYLGTATRLEVGARVYGGPSRSVFRLLPERGIVYASWKVSL